MYFKVDEDSGFYPTANGTDIAESYFLNPDQLKIQIDRMTEFITKELDLPGGWDHTTANTKVNMTGEHPENRISKTKISSLYNK